MKPTKIAPTVLGILTILSSAAHAEQFDCTTDEGAARRLTVQYNRENPHVVLFQDSDAPLSGTATFNKKGRLIYRFQAQYLRCGGEQHGQELGHEVDEFFYSTGGCGDRQDFYTISTNPDLSDAKLIMRSQTRSHDYYLNIPIPGFWHSQSHWVIKLTCKIR